MNRPLLLLVLLNFASIGLITIRFFRADFRPTLKWLAAAGPHFGAPALLIVAYFAGFAPLTPETWASALDVATVVLSASSIALMFFTWGCHRLPLAHFHQPDDVPRHLVTHGSYRRIRHPFYSSYLLLYTAAVTLLPHWTTLLVLGYVLVAFTLTAKGEEKRLRASEFGEQYARHMTRTGRFVPKLVGRDAAPLSSDATA